MDIHRPELAQRKRRRRIGWAAAGVAALALVTIGLSRLEPAAPTVERESVFVDTVRRGEMLRQVRGPGVLVPEEIVWVAAVVDARVDRIVERPGARVEPDTVVLELSNPEVERDALEAETNLRAAEADLQDLAARLESERLSLESSLAAIESDHQSAQLDAEAQEQLAAEGLVPEIERRRAELRRDQLAHRLEIETQRVAKTGESNEAQLAAERARVEQARLLAELRRRQAESLDVVAGIGGVLQQIEVEVGERVQSGANLARVARPDHLMAELRIPETQAKDVALDQRVDVDTRNGVVPGRVRRIDPAVQNGTVTVEIELTGALPSGARPDLSVDGTILIERLEDALYVGRPAYGQADSTITLFKLSPDGETATRTTVRLGRASVNTIEIVEGLEEGDRVILSDAGAWDGFDRIRLD
ncbi:MAG: HlyD family efflux transporter periplasmic adaptor subunit [Thermoanaerobaculia bacterium]